MNEAIDVDQEIETAAGLPHEVFEELVSAQAVVFSLMIQHRLPPEYITLIRAVAFRGLSENLKSVYCPNVDFATYLSLSEEEQKSLRDRLNKN